MSILPVMGFTSLTCLKTESCNWTTEKDEWVVLVFSHVEWFKTVSSNNSPLLSQRHATVLNSVKGLCAWVLGWKFLKLKVGTDATAWAILCSLFSISLFFPNWLTALFTYLPCRRSPLAFQYSFCIRSWQAILLSWVKKQFAMNVSPVIVFLF